jgi:hypothetical protein
VCQIDYLSTTAGKHTYSQSPDQLSPSPEILSRNIHRLEIVLIMKSARNFFANDYIDEMLIIFNKVMRYDN